MLNTPTKFCPITFFAIDEFSSKVSLNLDIAQLLVYRNRYSVFRSSISQHLKDNCIKTRTIKFTVIEMLIDPINPIGPKLKP